jgi:hypothetical protein
VRFGSDHGVTLDWTVVDKTSTSYTLLSSHIVTAGRYADDPVFTPWVMWSTSAARTWLNDSFLTATFEAKQRDTLVPGIDNSTVTLPTSVELQRFFASDTTRCRATGTDWARNQSGYSDANLEVSGGYSPWWLRDTFSVDNASCVTTTGAIANRPATDGTVGLRPLITLNASKGTMTTVASSGQGTFIFEVR